MKTVSLNNNKIFCLSRLEAQMLDNHVSSYLSGKVDLKDGDTIIDIGANIGIFGFKLFDKYDNIKMLAFEPVDEIYEVLKANVDFLDYNNFKTYRIALSDKNYSGDLTYFPNSPAMSTSNPELWRDKGDLISAVRGSLKHSPTKWWWSNLIPSFLYPLIIFWLRRNKKNIKCEFKKISYFIKQEDINEINLLKIDCEGNELKVLKGIDKDHWSLIKQIIIEVHDIDGRLEIVREMLKNKGYNLTMEKEKSLKHTNLCNIYAKRF